MKADNPLAGSRTLGEEDRVVEFMMNALRLVEGFDADLFSARTGLPYAAIADTIDENELHTGKRQEGLFNAAFGLTAKATSGLGGFVAGIVLDVVDLPAGAAPGEVDPETVTALGLGVGPGILVIWITVALILYHYGLTRRDHARIMSELHSRRTGAQPAD